jgi:hypothetical protein
MDVGKVLTDGLTGVLGGIAGGPIGMALGLLTGVAPDLVGLFAPHLAGPQASDVAASVVQVVAAATGKPNPTPSVVAGLTPEQRADLTVRLQQIAVQAEGQRLAADAAQRAGDLATLQAGLADAVSARDQTIALAKAGSVIAYGAPLMSAIVLSSFGVIAWLVMFRAVPPGSETLAAGVLEALKLLSVTIVGYWCGSSAGSARKDDTLANAQTALANSAPVR